MKRFAYSLALPITGPLTGAAYLQILAGAQKVYVRSITVRVNAATAATSFGLIRAATVGTASASSTPVALGAGPTSTALVHTAWSAAPTASGTVYFERETISSGATSSTLWTFEGNEDRDNAGRAPRGLLILPSAGLLLWNFGAGTASDTTVKITLEEEY